MITGNMLTFDFNNSNWKTEYPTVYTVTDNGKAWYTADTIKYHDVNSLRSYAITHNETSEMTISFTLVADGSISFNYSVKSEQKYDKLHVFIDDIEVLTKSGTVDWTDYTQVWTAGEHTLKLQYTKDNSNSTAPDCAAIGYLIVVGVQEPFATKWLVKSGNNYYNSAGAQVAITTLDAAAFETYGSDDKPTSDVLTALVNPSVLYWQDNDTLTPPAYFAAVTGTPPVPQILDTGNILMNDVSILGIQSVTAAGSDDLIFSISYDGGTTWAVDEVTLMMFNALTDFGTNRTQYRIKVKLPAVTSHIDSLIVKYVN